MDFINPMIDLIIPQISSKLYSDEDIFAKMNQYLNNQESNNNKTNLLRRLAELTKQNRNKPSKKKKSKIIRYRFLNENTSEEVIMEKRKIPREKEIDLELRQIKNGTESESNQELALLSLQEMESNNGIFLGSLSNKSVLSNVNEEGVVDSIKEIQAVSMTNKTDEEFLDNYMRLI